MSNLLISAEDLRNNLSSRGWLIFDVRHDLSDHSAGRRAYQQGHIPGALYLDHETELSAPKTGSNGRHPLPERRDFAALMRSQGLTRQSQVVVYDAGNGMFAAHLWWLLRWLGHEHVRVLDGGWNAWLKAGGEVETGERAPSVTEAQALQSLGLPPQPAMPTVDAQAVLANISQPSFTLLDARTAERYRGENEPIDPVAGHIPGALNRPSTENLQEDCRFKPAERLRQEYLALLGGRKPEQVVHQCGSGITACHNLFAMELAGLGGSALYHGSWSEWISDPSRPMARGQEG
ncbi:rhodanese-like domain-containing protein [Parapusillimonas granuli]|uniref:Sulfurtransferase n=1 Tax=Parapusillimonas granuli TaxID=380911 RepID=A0A853G665_9BURK|nr:thiosulfate/3-mercaptopyruvate sulfurtransferase [Parapusillimonas granuli]MEB2401503.1 sulfurtransferase [Alcaligenaceae bacterium]NYT51657.1 sulfurtransferase [Parapusillimonas granuli]